MDKRLEIAALVVAAGRGRRAPGDVPKQYRRLGGVPVLRRTIEAILRHPEVTQMVVVINAADRALYDDAIAGPADARLRPPVHGGAERQESVRLGIESLEALEPDLLLIHDGVRPFVGLDTVSAVIAALKSDVAVCAGVPLVETIQRTDVSGRLVETVPREGLWRAQTPQGFHFHEILAAHRSAAAAGRVDFTDDAAVAAAAGLPVAMVAVPEGNVKLTTPADFDAAEARLESAALSRLSDIRVGTGYDVHALVPGDGVTLCGVPIAHDASLSGHSDADVALHALTDAVLGAIGDGDIGKHFPPSDERWRGAASRRFIEDAVARVRARGGMIAHLDVTLVAEAPKIGPHRERMRETVAEICGISVGRVAVKATTNEGLGFAGRREGIAAIATATVRLPADE